MTPRILLDTNVLIALTSDEHEHYAVAQRWFTSLVNQEWGICPLTEAGFVRIVTNPASRPALQSCAEAVEFLNDLAQRPGYRYWPITESWATLTASFAARIFGHQQVTDAYLLGLAIREDGILVTFDRGLRYLAGSEFHRNLEILGSS